MEDPRTRFLEAEGQAHHLLDRLQSLDAEIQRHSSAADSLSDAREALIKLAQELGAAGVEMKAVIGRLDKIGTAQIIDRVDASANALGNGIQEMQSTVDRMGPAIEGQMQAQAEQFEKQIGMLRRSLERRLWITIGLISALLVLVMGVGAIQLTGFI